MNQVYTPIAHDEVRYWFDVLQDNSLDNIARVTNIHRDKVRKILDAQFKH